MVVDNSCLDISALDIVDLLPNYTVLKKFRVEYGCKFKLSDIIKAWIPARAKSTDIEIYKLQLDVEGIIKPTENVPFSTLKDELL